MWLQYAVSDNGEMISINQVGRGATTLRCPYCNSLLLAKKGRIKAHHFAHAGETCRQMQRSDDVVALPAYDDFNLHLPPKVLDALLRFPDLKGHQEYASLQFHELITHNPYNR